MITAILKMLGYVKQDASFGAMMDQLQEVRNEADELPRFIGYVELKELRDAGKL